MRETDRTLDQLRADAERQRESRHGGHEQAGGGGADGSFWAGVVSSTRDGSKWRWFYVVRRVRKSAAGYSGWLFEGPELPAFSALELSNGAAGLLGNGVDTANLPPPPASFEPKPIPTLALVLVRPVRLSGGGGGGGTEYWIHPIPNAIDGRCSE